MHNNHIPQTIHNNLQITITGPGTHMSGVCVSVICVCSGSYSPGDDGMWVVLSVLYISSVRDAPRDPHLIITIR
ncbi:hypothetical protein DPMN_124718 [Dreissena polymorpha]|uniref:Uncharacterized protein n=1 Tax=Dreissena polymorpha TaxID=45954 RepID=A0A9D4GT44_DREPO|nr:hypothetical protein DPMN_124718 [Dreissena polymorpha]